MFKLGFKLLIWGIELIAGSLLIALVMAAPVLLIIGLPIGVWFAAKTLL